MIEKIKAFLKKLEKRRLVFSAIAGLNFGLILVLGEQYNRLQALEWNKLTVFNVLIVSAFLGIFFYWFFGLRIKLKTDKKFEISWLKIFVPLMILSFILLLAFYPGNYCYDSVYQYHLYSTGEYGTHYPAIFCLLLGFFVDLGKNLFGNYEIGLAILLFLQAAVVNFALAQIISYTANKLKSKKFLVISVLFFILHPLVQVLTLSSCHDVIFGAMFALLVLELLKMSEDTEYFSKKSNYFKVGGLTILMCLFRNNGFFALLPALLVGLIVLKKYRVKFLLILAIPMVVFQGWNQVYARLIATETQSVIHEALNIPIQQIARALYFDHAGVWSEELELYFEHVCDWAAYGQYSANSDGIKNCLKDDYIVSHLPDFVAYWAKIGMKAPHQYIEAPGIQALGLYYPWANYLENAHAEANTYHPYTEYAVVDFTGVFEDGGAINISRNPLVPPVDRFFDWLIDKQNWSKVYGFRVIWSGAFTTFMMVIAVVVVLFKKNYKYLVPLGLIFGLILTVFLAPVVLFRYIFPVVLTVPIMCYTLVKALGGKSEEKD